jgi:hypothetical protein
MAIAGGGNGLRRHVIGAGIDRPCDVEPDRRLLAGKERAHGALSRFGEVVPASGCEAGLAEELGELLGGDEMALVGRRRPRHGCDSSGLYQRHGDGLLWRFPE